MFTKTKKKKLDDFKKTCESSTVVEQLTHYLKFKGLNPAAAGSGREIIAEKLNKNIAIISLGLNSNPNYKTIWSVVYFIEYSAHFYTLKMILKYSQCTIHGW